MVCPWRFVLALWQNSLFSFAQEVAWNMHCGYNQAQFFLLPPESGSMLGVPGFDDLVRGKRSLKIGGSQ